MRGATYQASISSGIDELPQRSSKQMRLHGSRPNRSLASDILEESSSLISELDSANSRTRIAASGFDEEKFWRM